jgi:hypothetical protein
MVALPFTPPIGLPASEAAAQAIEAALLWLARSLGWLGKLALIALVRMWRWFWGLPAENQGVLGVLGVCAVLACATADGYLADPRTLAEQIRDGIYAVIVAAVVGVAALLVWYFRETTVSRSKGHRVTARRTVGGNTAVRTYCNGGKHCNHKGGGKHTAHFDPGSIDPENKADLRQLKITADHEGGHAAAFLECGAWNVRARLVSARSAWTEGVLPCRPTLEQAVSDSVMVSDAGWLACGTKEGAGSDLWMRRQHLGWLPSKDRGRVGYEGRSRARRCVNSISGRGRIEQVSRSLQRTGKWR